jgi:hypothetical protein
MAPRDLLQDHHRAEARADHKDHLREDRRDHLKERHK